MSEGAASLRGALAYPFACYALEPAQVRLVGDEADALAERYQLFEARATWTRIIQVFVTHCSAEHPSDSALRLLTHFLYMTLFFNEGRSRGVSPELLLAYWQTLRGEPSALSHPVLLAAGVFRRQLAELLETSTCDPAPFYHYVGLNLASFARDSQRNADSPADFEAALSVRLHSISALGYFQLWKLLLAVPAAEEFPWSTDIFRCELLSAKIQGLANDLCSLSSDASDGSPNLVLELARARSITPERAATLVLEQHDAALGEFVVAAEGVLARHPAGSVRRYLTFIRSCTAGNFESMRALASRYA